MKRQGRIPTRFHDFRQTVAQNMIRGGVRS
jgi:hypothetical protein